MKEDKTNYSLEKTFLDKISEPYTRYNGDGSDFNLLDLLSKFKQYLISSGEFIETNSLSECELHGHSLQPVVGFDNDISDYQCAACGVFESDMPKSETNAHTISDEQIVDKAIELEQRWSKSGEMLKSTLQITLCEMAKWMQEQLNPKS